ncbi:hypothetical protein GALL_439210 [mine drainage metagenome]|uniref:Uncharacterized protein n=1 Tax=mine drainage metagenome TaxID=410659 RepID=A0A1J5PTG0_9ZZZZ
MLVVDGHTLRAVDLLDFVDQVLLNSAWSKNSEDFLWIYGTNEQLLPDRDVISFGDT